MTNRAQLASKMLVVRFRMRVKYKDSFSSSSMPDVQIALHSELQLRTFGPINATGVNYPNPNNMQSNT